MKRIKLVFAAVAAMTAMLSLGTGTAGADACFDDFARGEGGPPGGVISDAARGAAGPGEPGSGTDELAQGALPTANLAKNAVCPQR